MTPEQLAAATRAAEEFVARCGRGKRRHYRRPMLARLAAWSENRLVQNAAAVEIVAMDRRYALRQAAWYGKNAAHYMRGFGATCEQAAYQLAVQAVQYARQARPGLLPPKVRG